MSQKPHSLNKNGVETRRRLTTDQIRSQLKELQNAYLDLQYEKACLMKLIPAARQQSDEEEQDASLADDIQKATSERDYLLQEVADKVEENEDLYHTLLEIAEEKEKIRQNTERAKQELDSCKSVIDFLMLERDQLKLEIDTKSKLLECYGALYNKENMFHFRAPRSQGKR